MSLIETIIASIQNGLKIVTGEKPEEIKNFCIGSGSNFKIHKNITIDKANKIYKELVNKLQLNKMVEEKQLPYTRLQKWHSIESQTGYTYTFMFEITEIIEHDPNDAIKEWEEYRQKIGAKK